MSAQAVGPMLWRPVRSALNNGFLQTARHFRNSFARSVGWPTPTLRSSRLNSKPGLLSKAAGLSV